MKIGPSRINHDASGRRFKSEYVGKYFYYAPNILDMTEEKPFEIGDKVFVVEEVGDPLRKFLIVMDEKGHKASVDKNSLSKKYPVTLLYLTGHDEKIKRVRA